MTDSTVIGEIQKRPFVRLLIFWIAGILLQVCFPLQDVSFALPASVFIVLIIGSRRKREDVIFNARWLPGALLACLFVFLAIQMTGLVEQRITAGSEPGILLRKAQAIQAAMVEKLSMLNLPDADRSVLATITVNFRRAMTRELMNTFSVSGVSHILAVSGYHVGVVSGFVGGLLSFLPKRGAVSRFVKYLVIMVCVWSFAFVSGLTTAGVRAATMITIYLTGNVLGQNHDKYNTLAGAAFCMLVYNPFYLFDVGFQLSFSAVFFILYLQPRFDRLLDIKNPLIARPWQVLTITVSAQIGTCFLCFLYFGQTSLVFLFTNLFVAFLSVVLIPLALIWMRSPIWMPYMDVLGAIIETVTRWMMFVVESFSQLPGAKLSVRFDLISTILSYFSLITFLLYLQWRRYHLLIIALTTLLFIICRLLFFVLH
ncbi:MAG: ComEC/Rec2 family competence protein [Tannerella sp.]|jgi:competence protein ComEC|nr:ComEC/Rec2 family competence protein [Tannerella sp.]